MEMLPQMQQELMERFQALTPKEMKMLDNGIDKNAALVLLYMIIPEADSVLLGGLPSLKGHKLDPNRLLHGVVVGNAQYQRPEGPQGQPQPVPMAQPAPMEQPVPMAQPAPMEQGALGGLPGGNPQGILT